MQLSLDWFQCYEKRKWSQVCILAVAENAGLSWHDIKICNEKFFIKDTSIKKNQKRLSTD